MHRHQDDSSRYAKDNDAIPSPHQGITAPDTSPTELPLDGHQGDTHPDTGRHVSPHRPPTDAHSSDHSPAPLTPGGSTADDTLLLRVTADHQPDPSTPRTPVTGATTTRS